MTYITSSSGVQRAKWRDQSIKIAHELRRRPPVAQDADGMLRIGVAFDDGLIKIILNPAIIEGKTAQQLAEHIYNLVITEASKPNKLIPLEVIAEQMGIAQEHKGTKQ